MSSIRAFLDGLVAVPALPQQRPAVQDVLPDLLEQRIDALLCPEELVLLLRKGQTDNDRETDNLANKTKQSSEVVSPPALIRNHP